MAILQVTWVSQPPSWNMNKWLVQNLLYGQMPFLMPATEITHLLSIHWRPRKMWCLYQSLMPVCTHMHTQNHFMAIIQVNLLAAHP